MYRGSSYIQEHTAKKQIKYFGLKRWSMHHMPASSCTIPATITDRFISAFFSPICDIMLLVEMTFNHRLNIDRLRKALNLVMDMEPILGCRFVEDSHGVHFEQVHPSERSNFTFFTNKKMFIAYKNTSLDSRSRPAVEGALLRDGGQDIVLLKIAHEVADARGAKDIAYLIASVYRALKDNPDFLPALRTAGSRDIDQLMRHVPWYAFPAILFNAVMELFSFLIHPKSHNPFTIDVEPSADREYLKRSISSQQVLRMKRYGRHYGATINDLFLTAFFRALKRMDWDGKTRLRCGITVDLRLWHIPGGQSEALCNLSSSEICTLRRNPGHSFDDTLKQVVAITRKRKKNRIGLNTNVVLWMLMSKCKYSTMKGILRRILMINRKRRTWTLMFTNLGQMDCRRLIFDESPAEAMIIVPAGYAPFFGLGLSGYDNTLTLSAAAFQGTYKPVNTILDYIVEELQGAEQS